MPRPTGRPRPADADPEARLQRALQRLGPEWDEERLDHTPSDDETVHDVLSLLPSQAEPTPRLRPTGGWFQFLVPISATLLMIVGVLLMGMNLVEAGTGSLLVAGGFLLLVMAALGRGKRVQRARTRRAVEETLLLYDLELPVDRETFWAQVELVRDAKQALQALRSRQEGAAG